jgi:hypothetical protein
MADAASGRADPSANWKGHKSKRVNPRYRNGAEREPTGKGEGSRSNAQYRGAGPAMARARDAWGTEAQGTHDKAARQREGNAGAWRLCQRKAGGTLSPITVLTKLAWSVQKSGGKSLPSDGQQQPCRRWSRKPQALDPKGSLLTNRMSELFTYGSVGGVGRKPGSYPAANGSLPFVH